MVRQQFEATEGLLEDVMRKQAGSVEKAVLEAVMNSVDANAEEIIVDISEESIVISDDGDGMTREEIEEYFQKFGLKDDDIEDKEFGKFRMGRGQIFNFGENFWHSKENFMVVNLDHEHTYVHPDFLGDFDEEEIDGYEGEKVVLETGGLSYNLLPASSEVNGCHIRVNLYENLDDVESTVLEVRQLIRHIAWVHGVTIEVNGEEVHEDPEPDFQTDAAWFVVTPDTYGSRTAIYNQGAFVKDQSLTKTAGAIISKVDLDVNFARNDILDTDQTFQRLVEDYKTFTADYLLDQENIKEREKQWLLERAAEDEELFVRLRDKSILTDVEGKELSINDIEGETMTTAQRGNSQAEYVNENTDVVVLTNQFEGAVEDLFEAGRFIPYDEAVDQETKWEMDEYDYAELSTRRQQNFDRAEWFLEQVGYDGEVRAGYSMHADVWQTDENVLYLDKAFLNQSKSEFVLEGLIQVLEVAAQNGDTRHGLEHGYTFTSNFWDYAQQMGEHQRALLDGDAP